MEHPIVRESVHRDLVIRAATREMPVGIDELGRVVIVVKILLELRAAHPDLEILPDLEMQMSIVLAMGGPHGRDLLPATDALPATDEHRVQVAVESVDIADVA